MRLIDADKLIELLRDECAEVDDGNRDIDESTCLMTFRTMHELVDKIPTADVEEVVRCGECKKLHHEFKKTYCPLVDTWDINPRWYCADGERK